MNTVPRSTRCFVAGTLASGTERILPAGPSAHLARVLRLRAGAALTLFNGEGGEFEAQIVALDRDGVRVRVGAHLRLEREAPMAVTLMQCLARGERMDWIVQKATELGVAVIVPVASEHSVVRLDEAGAQRRHQHWQAVAISACEQCGRNRLPEIRTALSFAPACADDQRRHPQGERAQREYPRLVLAPGAPDSLAALLGARGANAPAGLAVAGLSLLIGPEGGLSATELTIAQDHGFMSCRLGPRILRAETAPLAALATIQALLGDFGERNTDTN
ncbi:MAG TPA: 16S rRNA (uracil(1498)-N(3))-methyltransferase [Steroidobacteraceae bacterium]|jgi:16S rRNA (uracil1498-N3)-methyltransferase